MCSKIGRSLENTQKIKKFFSEIRILFFGLFGFLGFFVLLIILLMVGNNFLSKLQRNRKKIKLAKIVKCTAITLRTVFGL